MPSTSSTPGQGRRDEEVAVEVDVVAQPRDRRAGGDPEARLDHAAEHHSDPFGGPGPVSGKRYLILAEGRSGDPHYGKTMRGVVRYAADPTVAILDSERVGETYEGIPIVGVVADALAFEPTTALVGVATQGGRFPPAWRELLRQSVASGLDVENGLHEYLTDDAELVELAQAHGVELRDLRKPPGGLNVPTGANLALDARIVLTVGSDCAIGKMTVSLELDREAKRRGVKSVFVPTGQTGIAIAGWGSRSTQSSPTSPPAPPSSWWSRAPPAAGRCSGSRARARSCTRRTRV